MKVIIATVAAAASLALQPAFAQTDFPNKSIRMVVGFTAGGISDVLARARSAPGSARRWDSRW